MGTKTPGKIVTCPGCNTKNRVPAATAGGGTPKCAKCRTTLAWIADADDSTFAAVVEGSKLPVLVDLWAPWCGPCRTVGPALERLAHQYAGRLKLVKVNVDDSPRLSRRFEAQSIPMLLLMDGSKVLDRKIGAAPESVLRTWLEKSLPVS